MIPLKIPPFCTHETPILSVYTYYSKKEIKNFDTKIIDPMAFGCLSNVFKFFFCSKSNLTGQNRMKIKRTMKCLGNQKKSKIGPFLSILRGVLTLN